MHIHLDNKSLNSQAISTILSCLSQLCHNQFLSTELNATLISRLLKTLLDNQPSQIDLIETLVSMPKLINYYSQDNQEKSGIIQLGNVIINAVEGNTLKVLNPIQTQELLQKLGDYYPFKDSIISKLYILKMAPPLLQAILSEDISVFHMQLETISTKALDDLLKNNGQLLTLLFNDPLFPIYLEQLLIKCSSETFEYLILSGTLNPLFLNGSLETLSYVNDICSYFNRNQNIQIINQLFKLLNYRKTTTKYAAEKKLCLELQIKLLNNAQTYYQQNILQEHLPLIEKVLENLCLSQEPERSLQEMHAGQNLAFEAHRLMDANHNPNLSEFYTESDIMALLPTRLSSNPNINMLAAIDPEFSLFKEIVAQGITTHNKHAVLIIPIHIQQHWVGISIQNIKKQNYSIS